MLMNSRLRRKSLTVDKLNARNDQNIAQKAVRSYIFGSIIGLLGGLVSAYFYNRAAEEEIRATGKEPEITTGQLLTIGLAGMGMLRQLTQLGTTNKKK